MLHFIMFESMSDKTNVTTSLDISKILAGYHFKELDQSWYLAQLVKNKELVSDPFSQNLPHGEHHSGF